MKNIHRYLSSLITHKLVQSSGAFFVGTMIVNFGAYIYHFLVGRILGPVHYGELSAILSLFFILNVPNTVLQTVLVKFFSVYKARNKPGQTRYLFTAATKKLILVIFCVFIVSVPFIFFISDFLHLSTPIYLIFLFGILVFQMLGVVNMSVLQGYQKFIELTFYTNIGMWTRVVLGVLGAFFGVGWTLVSNIAANIIGYIMFFIPLRFMLREKSIPITTSKKEIISYGFPTFLSTLGIMSLFSLDVILVKHFLSAHDAGIYSALSVLGRIIYFATSMIGLLVFPVISERHDMNVSYEKIVRYAMAGVAAISVILILIFYFFGSYMVRIMFGSAYDQAIQYVWLFGIFMANVSLSHLMVQIFLALNRKSITLISFCMALFQILGIFLYHNSLMSIILINILISSILSGAFVVLYFYSIESKNV